MFYTRLLLIIAIAKYTKPVKINMSGSVSLGKDVIDTLTYYITKNQFSQSGRRSLKNPIGDVDEIVKSANICKDLVFCTKDISTLLNKYVLALAKTTDSLIKEVVKSFDDNHSLNVSDGNVDLIVEGSLKKTMKHVREILEDVEEDIAGREDVYMFVNLVKKLCAVFLEVGMTFLNYSLNLVGDPTELIQVKKIIIQKLVIDLVEVEDTYLTEMCSKLNICSTSFECTTFMNKILNNITNMDNEDIKDLIRSFYREVVKTNFYAALSETTVRDFKKVLNDMIQSDSVPTKSILKVYDRTIQVRLNELKTNKKLTKTGDIQVLFAILSDMDHFYSISKINHFEKFYESFLNSTKELDTENIRTDIRTLFKDVEEFLSSQPNKLIVKLTNEVKVFLETTVDSEKL